MRNSNDPAGRLTVEQSTRIHSSLEAAHIVESFQRVCTEILGACDARVFIFAVDDQTRVLRFGGDENPKVLAAPKLEPSGLFGSSVGSVENEQSARQSWHALLPLAVGEDGIGILQVGFEHSVDADGLGALRELARALAVAVRNGQTYEKTKRLTFTDDLTALYNSRFMTLYLDRELKRCRRTRSSLSLLFMDLDGFKNINDTHGHLAGSRTLVEVGAVLEKTVRDADVLIRYGGDEFVILFPETPLDGGLVIAERIRQVIGNTRFLESQNIEARVSASIGIAAYPESADDVRSLISSADQAMYRAKALGKDRVITASPLKLP